MKFAIIAAGEGSRLAQEGVEEPTPLVSVCDQPMIERLMRIFVDCGASEIVFLSEIPPLPMAVLNLAEAFSE